MDEKLPAKMKQHAGQEACSSSTTSTPSDLAQKVGMGNRINTIMQAAFFKLAEVIPYDRGR